MNYFEAEFNKVELLINNGKFELAFTKLNNIIDNNKINEKEIAEVLNLKGVIVDAYAPYLNEFPDEGGLFYFAKALNYDEKNIGALFNIINSFNRHDLKKSYILSQKELFFKAYETLKNVVYSQLDTALKSEVDEFQSTYIYLKSI